jgi:predicted nucleic acid-binding protein
MIKVFIDTNVWFSGLYKPSASSKILQAHLNHRLQAHLTTQVIDELIRNVNKKFPPAIPGIKMFFSLHPPVFLPTPKVSSPLARALAHPHDAPLLTACLRASIRYFITGNLKHFNPDKIASKTGITILTPKQAADHFQL